MKYPHTKQVRNLREFLGKMKTVLIILIIELYKVKGVEISAAYSSGDCYDGSSVDLTLTCTVTEAAFSGDIFWRRGTDSIASCGYANDNDCVPSAGFIEPRYSFTSDVNKKEFYLKITPINTPVDIASFRCKHGSTGTDELDYSVRECVDCTVPTVANGQVNTTAEKVVEGTVIEVKCNSGYTLEGSAELTCQADQTWDNPVPTCTGTTTTTTTTTSTSTSTTTTTTPPPTTTTTLPSTTTATSTTTTTATPTTTTTTITTTPMPTTRTTTTTTPSTTARPTTQSPTTTPSTSTSSTPSTTTPSNTRGDSNTSLIAMIVVVSVIGGILVIAIVFMILVMVYGKSGLPLSTRRKGTHHRPAVDKHHRHHRHHKHPKRRERSEYSFYQPQNVLAGYSLYRGGVENPVFQESMDYPNTPVLYHKDANEMFHAPRYDEQPPEYQYAVNWEGLD